MPTGSFSIKSIDKCPQKVYNHTQVPYKSQVHLLQFMRYNYNGVVKEKGKGNAAEERMVAGGFGTGNRYHGKGENQSNQYNDK